MVGRPRAPSGRSRHRARASAAVLVALFEEDGETRVVLTRRTTTLPSHRGEVSFPGGKVDRRARTCRSPAPCGRRRRRSASTRDGRGRGRARPPRHRGEPLRPRAVRGGPAQPAGAHAEPGEVDGSSTCRSPSCSSDGVFREERWEIGAARSASVLLRARRRHRVGRDRAHPLPAAHAAVETCVTGPA